MRSLQVTEDEIEERALILLSQMLRATDYDWAALDRTPPPRSIEEYIAQIEQEKQDVDRS